MPERLLCSPRISAVEYFVLFCFAVPRFLRCVVVVFFFAVVFYFAVVVVLRCVVCFFAVEVRFCCCASAPVAMLGVAAMRSVAINMCSNLFIIFDGFIAVLSRLLLQRCYLAEQFVYFHLAVLR